MKSYAGSPHQLFYANGASDKVADDLQPYMRTIYEANPLNRIMKQGRAGQAWQPIGEGSLLSNDKTGKIRRSTNVADEVLLLRIEDGELTLGDKKGSQFYASGRLHVTLTFNEHNSEVREYADESGRKILRKEQYEDVAGEKYYAETYYVYDALDNLVIVLPPEAVKIIISTLSQR
jgi:hypothetical protein